MLTVAATVPPASNLMWSQILDYVEQGMIQNDENRGILYPQIGYRADWRALMARHSKLPSHPDTVDHIVEAVGPKCLEVLAGTAYWSWLLRHAGIDVATYDHTGLLGSSWRWTTVQRLDGQCKRIGAFHQHTLLMITPKNLRQAAAALSAFRGPRFVYVGQFPPPDGLFAQRLADWRIEDEYRPVYFAQEPLTVVTFGRPRVYASHGDQVEKVKDWPTMLVTEYSPLLGQDPPTSLSLSA